MGMTGGVHRASEAEIQRLLDAPESVEQFFADSAWAPPLREVRPKGLVGWLLKFTPVTIHENDPDAVPPPGHDETKERPHCDLDRMWHGLHFLFTGTASEGEEPACYLQRGGEDIGDPDEHGYSVLQALKPATARRFAGFLGSLSRQELERRYDPERMMALEIYPEIWARDPAGQPALESLLAAYENLRAFMDETTRTGDGAIVYVT